MEPIIRRSAAEDMEEIISLLSEAFGDERQQIIDLVQGLLAVMSSLSLVAVIREENEKEDTIVGHVMFSPVDIEPQDTVQHDQLESKKSVSSPPTGTPKCYILAPLGVLPKCQKQGVGKSLIQRGMELLSKEYDADAVFVYGDPGYYSKSGFRSDSHNVQAPFPLSYPVEAWQAFELSSGALSRNGEKLAGTMQCLEPLMKAELW